MNVAVLIRRLVLQVGLGTAHVCHVDFLVKHRVLRLGGSLRVLQILQPILQLLGLHMLLVSLSLLVEVVNSLQRFAILLPARLFSFHEIALLDLVVDEGMQLLLAQRVLHLSLRRLLLVVTLRMHQAAQSILILAVVVS